jgi:hypothetical protein
MDGCNVDYCIMAEITIHVIRVYVDFGAVWVLVEELVFAQIIH